MTALPAPASRAELVALVTHEPDVVFAIAGADFLRMVAGMGDPGEYFMFGRLKATGDLSLAARSRTFFVPPEEAQLRRRAPAPRRAPAAARPA